MAFQPPSALPRRGLTVNDAAPEIPTPLLTPQIEESQQWILFAPSTRGSNITQSATINTAELSRVSDLGSLNTRARSGLPNVPSREDPADDDDAELDSLDEGLHAFREPALLPAISRDSQGPVLPAHDGLGMFAASNTRVLEQIWQHEQFNPKRKHNGLHRRISNIEEKLDHLEELEAQASEEKRIRIEKWRFEQSQAMMEEVETYTRQQQKRYGRVHTQDPEILGSTPKQSDFLKPTSESSADIEPFWRRITRKFIQDVIGIDEPLLSVILGESLPEDVAPDESISNPNLTIIPEESESYESISDSWRDRLLQRIARELGVFVHQLSPHPGAFSTPSNHIPQADYAGIPVNASSATSNHQDKTTSNNPRISSTSGYTAQFAPTVHEKRHAQNWGFEDELPMSTSANALDSSLDLQREREYWERELDVKMVFRYLRDRFTSRPSPSPVASFNMVATVQTVDDTARRTAIIRQHHPLTARNQRSPVRVRRESRSTLRRPLSSCASESIKSGRRVSVARSGSSRNYWDLGGSLGSGSLLASGGLMGACGEV